LHYLSEHLASYGFAVAAIDHPKTNSRDYATFLSNLRKGEKLDEAVQRPLDVKYLLDALEQKTKTDPMWRDRLNPEQVGLIGHSLGGYTVLALGGAQINVNPECGIPEAEVISFNVSQMLQCRFSFLASPNINLSDRRVKAVFALNPLGGSMLFGKAGMQNIKVPLTVFSGGNDLLTPPIPEHIFPFVWSISSHKYLVAFPKGTHFSFLEKSERGVLIIPPALFGEAPEITHPYAKAITLAFFETYLNNRSEFAAYLNNAYIQAIASPQFPASLTTGFSEDQLLQAL
jgi:predicted dienelactone hydrolase